MTQNPRGEGEKIGPTGLIAEPRRSLLQLKPGKNIRAGNFKNAEKTNLDLDRP
jgi:hypothetical protein